MTNSTLLIVDDHEGFRSIARVILEEAGYDVLGEAADGAEALEAADRLNPELVLLDVELPDTNGFEVARELAEREDAPAVVLISGRRASDFGSKLKNAAALGFIAKAELSPEALAEVAG